MSQAAIEKAATHLVDRAREGDQNAMALLGSIGNNRKMGHPKAIVAYNAAMAYIAKKKRPARRHYCISFGGLTRVKGPNYGRSVVNFILDLGPSAYESQITAHAIAQLKPLDSDTMRRVLACMPVDIRPLFGISYRDPHRIPKKKQGLSRSEIKCLQLGYILGLAKRLQNIDKISITELSPAVGWELGE